MHNHQTDYNLEADIRRQFALEDSDLRTYSPLTLAYIGDGIYELILRTIAVRQGNRQVNKLHQQTSRYAKAQAQSYTTAKNASVNDYRRATGFEALMGYLYLDGNTARLLELVKAALENYTPPERQGTETRNHKGAEDA